MGTPQTVALRADVPPRDVVEGHVSGPAFDVKMHFTRWPETGDGVFEASASFIEMILSATKPIKGTYVSQARQSAYAELGDVAFIPARSPLYCAWAPGVQRCISCSFDIRSLFERAELDWAWPSFDLESALRVRNEYVRLGLRRIAEEVLSPGFASSVQIECTLMFVAFELRRHLAGSSRPAAQPSGSLTAKQLNALRNLVIDTPRAPPTIAELAAACGMGARQLALAYRKTTGVTLRRFIADARLERAKMLLLGSHAFIKQVAFDSGFQTSAAFTAAFRKATGTTPAGFRSSSSLHSSE